MGPYSRPGGPRQTAPAGTVALLLFAACLSLAGPGRAAGADGPALSWPAHCQGLAFTGMYGQDGTMQFTNTGKATAKTRINRNDLWSQWERVRLSGLYVICAENGC